MQDNGILTQIRFEAFLVPSTPKAHVLAPTRAVPNSRWPLLIYPGVIKLPRRDPAALIEELFGAHGWSGTWRNTIYRYQHYHSTTHEVLGVYSGSARVLFGGEKGVTEELRAGDVVLIPAGVAHRNMGASVDFGVVGAYPNGDEWDMNYCQPAEMVEAQKNITSVPRPQSDPVFGLEGPLLEYWKD